MKNFIAAALVIFTVSTVCADTPAVRYRRTAEVSQAPVIQSEPARKVRFFAEWAPYWLGQSFLGYWVDRPLYAMPEYRKNDEAGHLRELDIMTKYNIQGFASLDYVSTFKKHSNWEMKAAIPGIEHMLVVAGYAWPKNYGMIRDAVSFAVHSPLSPRINGKVLLSCYGTLKPEQTKELIAKLKATPGIGDTFLLPGAMPFAGFHADFVRYRDMGTEPPKWFLEKYRAAVREVLDSTDGIVLHIKDAEHQPGEQIWGMIVLPHFKKYMYPIIKEELARPEYKDKIVLGQALRGYVNHLSGNTVAEYGTSQLRCYLENMAQIRPDAVVLFEWNEANENTSFQPSITTSWATGRIIRYYSRIMNGQKPDPMPGDDTTVPNLILSIRRQAKLGELINYEVLNVPDGVFNGDVRFRLRLFDEYGKKLVEFPEEKVDSAKMTAISYRVATDDFGKALAVTPELEVITPDGKSRIYTGFDSTAITASVNVIYKEVNQPLRDLLIPEKQDFKVTANADGTIRLEGNFAAGEKLRSLEVFDGHTEVAASDPKNEFDYSNDAVFLGYFTAMGYLKKVGGTFKFHNVSRWNLRPDGLAHGLCDVVKKDGNTAHTFTYFVWMRSPFIMTVPKAELANAEVEISYPDPVGTRKIKLGDVWKNGCYSTHFGKNVRLEMVRANRLPDYTYSLNRNQASISLDIYPLNRYPVYKLTAIAESGKIWRSKPVVPHHPQAAPVPMTVFSEFVNAPVTKMVAADFIPRIEYKFTPQYGALLTNDFDQFFNAELGGGFSYLEPMHKTPYPRIPKNFTSLAPQWVNENGQYLLRFDGVSNYVNLPRETMPRGAYTIDMEIRTPGNRDQVLLRSYSLRNNPGTLQMVINKNNELVATSALNLWNAPFATGLKVPTDKWCKIRVVYDLKKLVFEVDGVQKVFPFAGRGFVFKPACFGGTDEPNGAVKEGTGYFKGDLRSLIITHNN